MVMQDKVCHYVNDSWSEGRVFWGGRVGKKRTFASVYCKLSQLGFQERIKP